MSEWRPLSVRESGETSAYDGPYEGVPEWLFRPLWEWVEKAYPQRARVGGVSVEDPNARGNYRRLGMALRIRLEGATWTDVSSMVANLHSICVRDPVMLLNVADYWLAHDSKDKAAQTEALEALLAQAKSVFRVQFQEPKALVRRVAPEAQALADSLMSGGRPGEHMARAWRQAYGRSGSPNEAYRESIKAVEAAAKPIVSPNNGRTTLGTVIRDMRAKPEKWSVRLRSQTRSDQMASLIGMLDALWSGQDGTRHGDSDESTPMDVRQEDAEAALSLALTLVHWFTTGVVTVNERTGVSG